MEILKVADCEELRLGVAVIVPLGDVVGDTDELCDSVIAWLAVAVLDIVCVGEAVFDRVCVGVAVGVRPEVTDCDAD